MPENDKLSPLKVHVSDGTHIHIPTFANLWGTDVQTYLWGPPFF